MATPTGAAAAAPVSLALKKKRSISDSVASAAVKAAVMLKQSPIPDTVATLTQSTLTGYTRVDAAFGVHDRLVSLGQSAVKMAVDVAGVLVNAGIRAGVAYQVAPGYKDHMTTLLQIKSVQARAEAAAALDGGEEAADNTDPSASSLGWSVMSMLGLPPIAAHPHILHSDISGTVRTVRLSTFPGSMPLPTTVDMATQTEDLPVSTSTPPAIPHKASSQQQQPPQPTIISSVVSRTTNLAATLLTNTSTLLIGPEKTSILFNTYNNTNDPQSSSSTSSSSKQESPIRDLIVGGKHYATTLKTLTRVPNSRLHKIFASTDPASWVRLGVETIDGSLFIDRDGEAFRHVLNHLRGMKIDREMDGAMLRRVREEAVWYDLVGLVVEIDELGGGGEVVDDATADDYYEYDDDDDEDGAAGSVTRDEVDSAVWVDGLSKRGHARRRRGRNTAWAVATAAAQQQRRRRRDGSISSNWNQQSFGAPALDEGGGSVRSEASTSSGSSSIMSVASVRRTGSISRREHSSTKNNDMRRFLKGGGGEAVMMPEGWYPWAVCAGVCIGVLVNLLYFWGSFVS